ncbi:hypothetical protein FVEG_16658 [Fusarium verticillioides 7600]|uniref:Uncharacterized protein n=1 Tax=Gibberella moniliformis (strain M3125 / FGSC 7600) TaxID=334819 RepID=W7MS64_GIBM7|nr:hypothetical protein FVEG_16658 [Fusarium verticillioides 7600]EWG50589.1 hypothetical protein FVEG_16658 [Fusarium verticillioides 7600]
MYTRGLERATSKPSSHMVYPSHTHSLDQSHPLLGKTMTETHVLCARYPPGRGASPNATATARNMMTQLHYSMRYTTINTLRKHVASFFCVFYPRIIHATEVRSNEDQTWSFLPRNVMIFVGYRAQGTFLL